MRIFTFDLIVYGLSYWLEAPVDQRSWLELCIAIMYAYVSKVLNKKEVGNVPNAGFLASSPNHFPQCYATSLKTFALPSRC